MSKKLSLLHFSLLLSILLVFGITGVSAQQASLQGIVSDQATGQPLYGANILLKSTTDEEEPMGAATDSEGFYSITSPRELDTSD